MAILSVAFAFVFLGWVAFFAAAVIPSALETCEEDLLHPIYVEIGIDVVVAALLLLAACFPLLWAAGPFVFGLKRFIFLLLGIWQVALCFSFDGWNCREAVRAQGYNSLTWSYVFLLGLLHLVLSNFQKTL